MTTNNKDPKMDEEKGKAPTPNPKMPVPPTSSLGRNILVTVLIFMIITAAYIFFSGRATPANKSISLSELAKDVTTGTVKTMEMR